MTGPFGRPTAVGFATVQVFTKSNNQWRAAALTEAHISAFRAALAETGVCRAGGPRLVSDQPWQLPTTALWEKSIASLALEIERGEALGIEDLVIHPGAHVGIGRRGRDWPGSPKGSTRFIAGPGAFLCGSTWKRPPARGPAWAIASNTSARILELVGELRKGSGVCVDTCHIFAAGYPLGTPSEYHDTMGALDPTRRDESRVRVLHLNDSLRGTGKPGRSPRGDRPAAISGSSRSATSSTTPDSRAIPMILETPKGEDEAGVDLDAVNLSVLARA